MAEVVPPAGGRASEGERAVDTSETTTYSGAARVILTFLTSSGLTSDAVYSNSGLCEVRRRRGSVRPLRAGRTDERKEEKGSTYRYMGLLRMSLPVQIIVSPGREACDCEQGSEEQGQDDESGEANGSTE